MAEATFKSSTGLDPAEHFKTIIVDIQPTEADLLAAGQYLRGKIRERTFADTSYQGGNFIPYAPSYAKAKGQHNVDLYGRGAGKHMLDSLTVKADSHSIDIGIYGDDKMATRAKAHNEGATGKTRQGSGKHVATRISRKFGAEIRSQKKGGSGTFTIPMRPWLGATTDDLDTMRWMIIETIDNRLSKS